MAEGYLAEVDKEGVVRRVIVVRAAASKRAEAASLRAQSRTWATDRLRGNWIDCYGKRFPGPGWTWDAKAKDFVPPQPYPSWTWDGERWQPPVPMPDKGDRWIWDEEKRQWIEVKT